MLVQESYDIWPLQKSNFPLKSETQKHWRYLWAPNEIPWMLKEQFWFFYEYIFVSMWFNSHSNPLRSLLLTPFFRWKDWYPSYTARSGKVELRSILNYNAPTHRDLLMSQTWQILRIFLVNLWWSFRRQNVTRKELEHGSRLNSNQ